MGHYTYIIICWINSDIYKQANIILHTHTVHNSTLPITSLFVLSCLLIKHITNGTAPRISSTNRTTPTVAPTIAVSGGAAGTGAGVVVVSLGCLQIPKLLHNPSFAAKTDDDKYNVPVTPNK